MYLYFKFATNGCMQSTHSENDSEYEIKITIKRIHFELLPNKTADTQDFYSKSNSIVVFIFISQDIIQNTCQPKYKIICLHKQATE